MNKLFEFDREFNTNSSKIVVGVDEVGRGPGAGPVCACAYSFYENFEDYINEDEKILLIQATDVGSLCFSIKEASPEQLTWLVEKANSIH